jgi:hypothetical protein
MDMLVRPLQFSKVLPAMDVTFGMLTVFKLPQLLKAPCWRLVTDGRSTDLRLVQFSKDHWPRVVAFGRLRVINQVEPVKAQLPKDVTDGRVRAKYFTAALSVLWRLAKSLTSTHKGMGTAVDVPSPPMVAR